MPEYVREQRVEAMQWVDDDYFPERAAKVVAWVNANGGEARYESREEHRFSNPGPRIAVHHVSPYGEVGWLYAAPGDFIELGGRTFDPDDKPWPERKTLRSFVVRNAAYFSESQGWRRVAAPDNVELLEDADGAPLPDELQRGGSVYQAALDALLDEGETEAVMVSLAPALWSLLNPTEAKKQSEPASGELPRCVDGGACHHGCTVGCWRVKNASPLSGVYSGGHWPNQVIREYGESDGHV